MTSCRRLPILLILLLLLSTRLLAQETYVHIRWVNLIPDAPAMNFHLNSSSTEPLRAPVSFRGASDPVIMASLGTAGVYFTDASNGAELFSTNVPLANNTRQNIVLIGRLGSIQARLLPLTIPPPTESPEADFRFMNASPNGGPVDLKITEFDGSVQTVTGLAFGQTTDFLSLAVGMTRLEVFAAGTQNRLLNVQGLVRAGYFYTGFVAGMANDLDFRVLIESDQRTQNPMVRWVTPPPPNDAELRLVNMTRPDEAIDIYMDGVRKLFEVNYRSTSAITGIPSGSRTFAFVRSGESLDQAFHTETVVVAPGTSISALVTGVPPSSATVQMLVRTIADTVPAGSTRARVMLANDIGTVVDIVLRDSAGTELRVDNAQPGALSAFTTFASGPIMLELAQTGQPSAVRYLTSLPSGSIATIFVSGDRDSGVVAHVLIETDPAVRRPMVELTNAGSGGFRFIQAAPPTSGVTITAGTNGSVEQTIAPSSAGEGIEVLSGLMPLVVRPTGSSTPMFDLNVRVGADSVTSTYLVGVPGSLELVTLFTPTSAFEPDPGTANVRVFVAAPIPQPLDVEIIFSTAAKRRLDTLEYKEATPYIRVPAGAITVNVYPRGGQTPIARLSGSVAAEEAITLVLLGVSGTGEPIVAKLLDSEQDGQSPMTLLTAVSTAAPQERSRIATMRIAPNPARDAAQVEYTPSVAGTGRVVLYDITGRRRGEVETGGDAVSTRRASIPVSTLESGIYSVVVIEADGSNSSAGVLQIVR